MSKHDKIAKLKEYIKNFVIKELEKDEEIDEVSTTATAGAANPMGTGIYYDTPKAFSSGSVGHKSPEVGGYKKVKEDIDVGHQDNEPDMLKSTALEIHEYGKKLYNALDKYDKMENEVDFPNWWQSKLIVSKDYLQKAYHYLDSEEKKDGVQESVNESKELDTIEKIVKSAKNFMGVGNALKKVGIKSDFQTSMGLPRYTFKLNGKTYGILNKKNVSKPDRVVGDIAFGVMESINEKKKMFPPKKMTPKQAKEYKKFIDYAKMGIEYQIDMSLFESVNEDGHTDVASSKRKVMIMVQDSNKLLNKLNGMNKEDSLPSWWSDKITLSQNYLQKATNYLLNPVESVNEAKEPDVIAQLRDIVKRKTNKKIKDPKTKKTMRVDMFTANVITQVYDAIKKNSSHRQKFESLPLDKMAQLSFKMMK